MCRAIILLIIVSLVAAPISAQEKDSPASRDFIAVGESLGISSGQLPELWALVVGVSEFQYGNRSTGDVRIRNLRYAARDADAVHEFLTSENGGFKKDHVVKLVNQDATKAKVEEALFNFLGQAREQDYVFIFFASHGAYAPDQSGPNQTPYLILYDTDPQRIAQTGLGVDVIGRAIKQVKAKRGIFISDACHSGGLEFASGRSSNDEARVRNYLREQVAESKEGIVYLSAANSVEKSYEYPELEHGVFTYYLLEGLRGNARASRPDAITVRDLWVYIQKKVSERTEGKQHPVIGQNRYDPNLVVSVFPRTVAGVSTTGSSSNVGTLSITIRDEDQVVVTIDGQPIEGGTLNSDRTVSIPLQPGSHTVQATKGQRVFRKDVTINPGKTTHLPIRLPLPVAEPSSKIQGKFQEAVLLFEKFKTEEAIARFNEVAQLEPNFPDTYSYLGRAEMKAGRPERAISAYDKALELDPFNTRVLVLKAEALIEQGDLGGAQELLKQLVNDDPEDGFAPLVLGYAYYHDNKFQESERMLQTSINRDPTNPIAHLQMAYTLEALNERDRAIESARTAIKLFNEFQQQQKKESGWMSILMSTRVIKFLDKNNLADAHLKLGVLLLADAVERGNGDLPQEAIANIDKAHEFAQASNNKFLIAQASYYRSEIYRAKQEFDRAIDGYQKALAHNGELATAYRGLSWCYEKQQKFQQALDSYQKYVSGLTRTDYERERDKIERRLKRLKEQARAHGK